MRVVPKFFFVCLLFVLAACSPASPKVNPAVMTNTPGYAVPSSGAVQATSYPVTPVVGSTSAYPPVPTTVTVVKKEFKGEAVPIRLATPLKAGALEVKGTGPKGVPIILCDITFSGKKLADATVGQDDTFTFTVAALPAEHKLGIKLGDLSKTEWNEETFNDKRFMGPGALLIPQDAFYYDTALVSK